MEKRLPAQNFLTSHALAITGVVGIVVLGGTGGLAAVDTSGANKEAINIFLLIGALVTGIWLGWLANRLTMRLVERTIADEVIAGMSEFAISYLISLTLLVVSVLAAGWEFKLAGIDLTNPLAWLLFSAVLTLAVLAVWQVVRRARGIGGQIRASREVGLRRTSAWSAALLGLVLLYVLIGLSAIPKAAETAQCQSRAPTLPTLGPNPSSTEVTAAISEATALSDTLTGAWLYEETTSGRGASACFKIDTFNQASSVFTGKYVVYYPATKGPKKEFSFAGLVRNQEIDILIGEGELTGIYSGTINLEQGTAAGTYRGQPGIGSGSWLANRQP